MKTTHLGCFAHNFVNFVHQVLLKIEVKLICYSQNPFIFTPMILQIQPELSSIFKTSLCFPQNIAF